MISSIFIFLSLSLSQASIPRASFILEKTSANAGSGAYQIDQDLVFAGAQESLTLRESWIIEGDNLMKVVVTGPKELQDAIKMQFNYSGGQKSFLTAKGRQAARIGEDFIEKYFHFRTRDALAKALVQDKIIPASIPGPKPIKASKDYVYVPEPFTRLSRVGGVITYQLGAAPKAERDANPAIWIEQDLFQIRKLRLPSSVEVSADNYANYARGLSLPKNRTVRWNQKSVQINLVRITQLKTAKGAAFYQANNGDIATRLGGIKDADTAKTVEEFYQRFR
jgi:hypothetical protein